jgi:beta-ribofuranosylaminobenzene 5'-phosphate synthase
MTIRINAYPRIHIGLIDLSGTTPRAYGGAGLYVDWPATVVEVSKAEESNLKAPDLENRDREDLKEAIERWEQKTGSKSIDVDVKKVQPQHIGLGSKTALILSILSGANICWGLKYSSNEIQKMSCRGGVSGIGINAFYFGGFLVDSGHPQSVVPPFKPSSHSIPEDIPSIMVRLDIPDFWEISLFLPDGNRLEGSDELDFFENHTPISELETLTSLSNIYHGVVPAFLDADLQLLSESLIRLHETGFKKCEVDFQSESVREVLQSLQQKPKVAAGMSSVGPLVYAIHEKNCVPDVPEFQTGKGEFLGTYPGRNNGADFDVIKSD